MYQSVFPTVTSNSPWLTVSKCVFLIHWTWGGAVALDTPGLPAGLGPGCGSEEAQVSSPPRAPHSGTEAAGAACVGSALLVDTKEVAGRRAPSCSSTISPTWRAPSPTGQSRTSQEGGGCAPPAEEGQRGWEKTVAVPGTKGQSSTHMERKERGSWGSTG